MASSARSTNRRTTPQAAPQTTRVTRSQSRDPIENPSTQLDTQDIRRGSRQSSFESNYSQVGQENPNAKGRRAKRAAAQEDLSVVPEDAVGEDADASGAARTTLSGNRQSNRNGAQRLTASPEAHSAFSGTTAMSHTAEEAAELDPNLVTESLTELHNAAQQILKIIVPQNATHEQQVKIIGDLKSPGTTLNKRLARQWLATEDLLTETFRCDNNLYVSSTVINRALFDGDSELIDGEARPDEIVLNGNLAIFAKDILTSERDRGKAFEKFIALDLEFPRLFMSSLQSQKAPSTAIHPGSSALRAETLKIALDVRTQLAIMVLKDQNGHSSFDPDHVIAQIFLVMPEGSVSDDADGATFEQYNYRGWPLQGLSDVDDSAPTQFQSVIAKRVEKIRSYILDFGDTIDFDGLEAAFPWSEFIMQAAEWARKRSQEIETRVDLLGGVDRIAEQVGKARERLESGTVDDNIVDRTDQHQVIPKAATQPAAGRPGAGAVVPPHASTANATSGQNFKKVTAQFSEMFSKRKSLGTAPAQEPAPSAKPANKVASSAPGLAADDDWRPPDNEFDDLVPAVTEPPRAAPSKAKEMAVRYHQSQGGQDKENMRQPQSSHAPRQKKLFIDQQAGAVRISFEDSSQPTQRVISSSSNSNRKRGHKDDEEEREDFSPTQDEGFQNDQRVMGIRRNKRLLPPTYRRANHTLPTVRKRQRSNVPVEAQQVEQDEDRAFVKANNSEEEADYEEEENASGEPGSVYQATTRLARQMVASIPKSARVRRTWSEEEESCLIDLVADYGCKYALIKQVDNESDGVLVGRTQVDLKDKCRIIRFNFHKAGQVPPKGFEQATLKTSQKDFLKDNGIPYE
ncbi:MAG: hypothetical protein M1820_008776 [Bogoriella megaspora]|nr:MAG: hypothetical protein M1820_008776 [Bogoriella megaspora]